MQGEKQAVGSGLLRVVGHIHGGLRTTLVHSHDHGSPPCAGVYHGIDDVLLMVMGQVGAFPVASQDHEPVYT
jgi:hypothetical protein